MTRLFPLLASITHRQAPPLPHTSLTFNFQNFCFQSDRINAKEGKNFKNYLNILIIKSNFYSSTTKYCRRKCYENALLQEVGLKIIMIIINNDNN